MAAQQVAKMTTYSAAITISILLPQCQWRTWLKSISDKTRQSQNRMHHFRGMCQNMRASCEQNIIYTVNTGIGQKTIRYWYVGSILAISQMAETLASISIRYPTLSHRTVV